MTDAAEIARKLSKAQKRALLWLPEDGTWRPYVARVKGGIGPTSLGWLARRNLAIGSVSGWRMTDHLGVPVRAALARLAATGDAGARGGHG